MHDHVAQEIMARAIRLAGRGLYTTAPNPRVGCVLVRDGEIVGEGWHIRAGGPHAEVIALMQAGARARGATAYLTLEPCCHHGRTPPCTDALLGAGVKRVIAAMPDPNPQVSGRGFEQLGAAGVDVEIGLLRAQAEALNPGFIMRHRLGRPFVRAKLAMTLDGRTATARGSSQWITAAAARRDVQRLRARSCAIMTGIGTVLADDPALTVRPDELDLGEFEHQVDKHSIAQPLRVIVDSQCRIPATARLLAQPGPILVAAERECGGHAAGGRIEVCAYPGGQNRVDLAALLSCLAQRQVNEVLLEAGPTLSGALLQSGLIDELVLYVAPKVLGDTARGLFSLKEIIDLDQALDLTIEDVRAVGADWRMTARLKPYSGGR